MSFILDGGSYEWKILNDGNTYGAENLSEGVLEDALFDKLSIGNVIAKQLRLTMWDAAIDPQKPVELKLSKTINGETTVHNKGVFFIDRLNASPYSEFSDITAYDALLKADAPFMTTGEWAPVTDVFIAKEIAERIGVDLDLATEAFLTANAVIFTEVPNIGDNGTTMREILSVIAAMHGGNWIIGDDNKLTLVLLSGRLFTYGIVTVDDNGLFEVKEAPLIEDADTIVYIDGNGKFIAELFSEIDDTYTLWAVDENGLFVVDTWANLKAAKPVAETLYIGDEVTRFDISPVETIEGVEVWNNASFSYRAWDSQVYENFEDIPGTILSVDMPLMASIEVAESLFAQYNGFEYLPYTASGVYADPEAPLGTLLQIKDKTVVLTRREQNTDVLSTSEMSADMLKEAISYYPYLTPMERTLQRGIDQNRTAIEVQDGEITSIVQTFNEELGINIAELTSHSPTDVYNASTNPDGYWRSSIISLNSSPAVCNQLGDGSYHIEFTHSLSSPQGIRFLPKAIVSLDAENLTLMMEVRNASYTGDITFGSAAASSGGVQYAINNDDAVTNPSDGTHYFRLTKSTASGNKPQIFRFGTSFINNGKGLSMDIRLSLYRGAYDGAYVPWSANSYNSRVTQTADGILISLATKITEAEAQELVDAYGTVVEQYLRFANGILELGESNSQFKALLSNTKLAFTGADGREVAWISNNQLYINNAIINGSLSIRYDEDATTMWRQFVRRTTESGVDKDILCIKAVK